MTAPDRLPPALSRRTLAGLATAGIGLPVLAACAGDDGTTAVDPAVRGTPSPSGGGENGDPGKQALTSAKDVEVGGGTIFPEQEVVVTQPTQGEFRCFSAVCTHQGCIVSSVSDGDIHCECHGSAFSIVDGSVVNGPAVAPLAERRIRVRGGEITLT